MGTVLSETLTLFFGTACILAASYALKAEGRRAAAWWAACGVLGGMATMVRPDSGLLLAAAGGTLGLRALASAWKKLRGGSLAQPAGAPAQIGYRLVKLVARFLKTRNLAPAFISVIYKGIEPADCPSLLLDPRCAMTVSGHYDRFFASLSELA